MKKSYLFLLTCFILAGWFIRLYHLDFQSVWTEEQYTATMATKSFLQIWGTVITTEFNPPGFFWVEHVAYLIGGYQSWVFRVPSVIAGTLLIPAIYALGRDFKGEITGLFCAGMVTVSYTLFYYSQFARAYELSILLFVVALIYWVKIRSGDTRYEYYILFGLFTGLSLWVHFYVIIPLFLLWVILFWRTPRISRYHWLIHGAIVATVISLPLATMLYTFVQGRIYSSPSLLPYGVDAWNLLMLIPIEFFESTFLIFALLILMGLYVERANTAGVELSLIGVVTIITGLAISFVSPMYARYFLVLLPILFLIASCFLSEVLKNKSDRVVLSSVLIFTALLFIMQYHAFVVSYTIQQYPGIFLP